MLRQVQEVLADKEFRNGDFYHHKGSFPAAASRFDYCHQAVSALQRLRPGSLELADAAIARWAIALNLRKATRSRRS